MIFKMLFVLFLALLGVLHEPSSVQADFLRPPHCGYSNVSHSRIVGGQQAKLGAWPWIAALGYRTSNPKEPNWKCGGSLISSRHILTAAHCLINTLYIVRVGDLNLYRDDDGAHPIDSEIEKISRHPGYVRRTHTNDIAVLTLKNTIAFTANIHPICLPVDEPLRSMDFLGTEPFVAGWGALRYNGPGTAELREVQVPVVSNSVCKAAYDKVGSKSIDDRDICAGYATGGKDSCQGDSGGPLIIPENEFTYYEIGVVAFGHGCASPRFPGVYTRVTQFIDFIASAMA